VSFKRVVDVVQVLVLVAAGLFVVALFTNDGSAPPAAESSTEGGVDASAVFAANCAVCHGSDGSGGRGPALGGGAVVESFPEAADQVAVITDGRGGMPAFGGRLSAAEIQAVTEYTRTQL
jgi:mono/diheme cytochrome c family protein